ncbi:MAG: restriction endonuclease subunit S [Candidatus Aenigmarchaeota archaeon]|nr:restriction endonuclease subunit S [Candidatus Aenigmarchaeota archaeon]
MIKNKFKETEIGKIPKDWEIKKWGDLATLEYGKGLKGYKNNNGKYPVYGTNGKIGWCDEPLWSKEGVIIGRKGAYRGVHFSKIPFFVIDTAFYLKPKLDFHIKWAYYELLTQEINNMDAGSAIPSTTREDFYNLNVKYLPITEQKAIAKILSNLDDKIEFLQKQNKILEEIGRTIFRHWFVDFEFPDENGKPYKYSGGEMIKSELGEIPKGWSIGILKEVIEKIESGKRPKGGIKEIESGVPSIGAENILGLGKYDYSKTKLISEDFFKTLKQGIIKSKDVLLYKDGAKLGRKSLFMNNFPFEKCCINEHVFILRGNSQINQFYLYFWLDQKNMTEKIINLNSNCAQPGITRAGVLSLPIIIPKLSILNEFNNALEQLLTRLFANCLQIQTIQKTRDLLLPKLMSGKIRVGV